MPQWMIIWMVNSSFESSSDSPIEAAPAVSKPTVNIEKKKHQFQEYSMDQMSNSTASIGNTGFIT